MFRFVGFDAVWGSGVCGCWLVGFILVRGGFWVFGGSVLWFPGCFGAFGFVSGAVVCVCFSVWFGFGAGICVVCVDLLWVTC